ncbi:IS1182 family transposase [Rossellomorea sp. LjRoot5]|uniref:IS1182 family transposase n=1 Tax=Rossellomorea sp. LjRoot5 TaxID=3342331 RepID=UPI003ECF6EE3
MLSKQEELVLSPYYELYNLVVPKDNLLRQTKELVDFSFILDELKKNYSIDNGRNAIPPIRMFKYLLLKVFYDLSDVDVVERSRYDLSFKYFLDLAPEEPVIDPSSLTKFRRLRIKDMKLLDLLIGKTVEIALEHNLLLGKSIILDATHTSSRYNSKSATQYLQELSKKLRKTIYQYDEKMKESFPSKPVDGGYQEELTYTEQLVSVVERSPQIAKVPSVKEKLNVLKEAVEDSKYNTHFSTDPDARVGHKSEDHSFHGYKTHLALSDERIITAAIITSGEKSDGNYLPDLIDKTKKNGVEIEAVIGDKAYSRKENLIYANKEKLKLVSKLHPLITNGRRKDDSFVYNKDAGRYMCPAGHLSKNSGHIKKRDKNRNTRIKFYWDIEECKECPIREGCYTEGAKTKSYSLTIKSKEHSEHETFQHSEEFKELSRSRYKIEAKNSELKNRHGYDKANAAGLLGMHIQGATSIFAVNIKRIIKLMNEKK